jgi:hypothetical protein
MSLDSNNFFTPKSIFNGTNADGSKFKVTEWEAGSLGHLVGNGDGMGFGIMLMALLMILGITLILPIMLLYCMFSYNGRIQTTSVLGILASSYALYDIKKHWYLCKVQEIAFGVEDMPIVKGIIIGTLVGHIVLVLTSIITKGSLFVNDREASLNESKVRIHPKVIWMVIISFFVTYLIVNHK